MVKLFALLFALCVVPSIATAHEPLTLKGTVLCDLCAVGFETSAIKPLEGALVGLECSTRTNTSEITHKQQAVTDSQGQYEMKVVDDHADNICNVNLLKSEDLTCNTPSIGREKSRVILTCDNGLATKQRYANTMLFESKTPWLPAQGSCRPIRKLRTRTENE